MYSSIYRSKEACVKVLRAVEKLHPTWWTQSCSEFLSRIEQLPLITTLPNSKVLIILEGLDGVGKSVVAQSLVDRLGNEAQLLRTPHPSLNNIREIFRVQNEEISRAFYSAANYLAAWEAAEAQKEEKRFIIFDRWWCSTCAMTLANRCPMLADLPARGNDIYNWPQDLPRFDVGVLLYVEEHIRIARIHRRAPADAEERKLASQQEMREVAMEAYRRFNLLTEVHVSTYGVAVNRIFDLMREKGVKHDGKRFTDKELAEIHPF